MTRNYHKFAYAWKQGNPYDSYFLIDEYLRISLGEDVFSIDDDFFEINDTTYWKFLLRLTNNDHRRNAFCSTFSALWSDFPSYDIFRLLLVKDFREPSMIKALGMENFGFEEPEENFDLIISELRASTKLGLVTNINKSPLYDGRVHLNFEHLLKITKDGQWLDFRDKFQLFEKEINDIGYIPYSTTLDVDPSLLLAVFLHQTFGEYSRQPNENYNIVTGVIDSNRDWMKAISSSIEILLNSRGETELDEFVKSTANLNGQINGESWLRSLLDYSVNTSYKNFLKLY
jgi:hypothetical protein